ncbi:exosortase A [Noviherbaspirillum massiliense]|uniref:exosortase A n=1 Tax=Noviherbaspirillum massiliense TaxID=1465823 RepID=UPI0002D4FD6E|nr:exosortase A [Noviherbaspirillum massiliense]
MNAPRPYPAHVLPGIVLAVALLAPLTIYLDTARSIVSIWNSSETFVHGYVIAPISLWLVWRRREELMQLPLKPCWPALVFLAAAGFGWLMAELANVQVVRQYMLVAMLPLIVLAVAGMKVARTLAFPLFFLLLAVPFGEIFIDPLIRFTADFTVAALQWTGIPVLRNGSHFEIPTGSWSVVEACSGVRYLISSFTLGCLYAYLNYRSRLRRAAFVLLSIVVPIIANGVRAYLIVMIGHLSGNRLAAGVDHLIYGWVFFGIVMFLMFWLGSFWREDEAVPPAPRTHAASASVRMPSIAGAAIASIAFLAFWPWYAGMVDRASFNPATPSLSSFAPEWKEAKPFTDWKPGFMPSNMELRRFFERGQEHVGVSVMFYRNQRPDAQLISSSNRFVPEGEQRWLHAATVGRIESVAGHELALREARISAGSSQLLVWSWYWIDGRFTASDYVGKLLQAKEKLLLRGDDGAALFLFAPYTYSPEEARAAMRSFLAGHLQPLEAALGFNRQ